MPNWATTPSWPAPGLRPMPASATRTWASSARPPPLDLAALAQRAGATRARPLVVPGDGRPLRRVAWCTGGAQGYFEAAIAAGADAFLTGEISEPQAHWRARPAWPSWPAATTPPNASAHRRGVPIWRAQFGLRHRFIDIDNPA
jgi:hypothetical protein